MISGSGGKLDQECKFLKKSSNFKLGYFCNTGSPCPHLENVSMNCPIIGFARAFEGAAYQRIISGDAAKEFNKEIKDVRMAV